MPSEGVPCSSRRPNSRHAHNTACPLGNYGSDIHQFLGPHFAEWKALPGAEPGEMTWEHLAGFRVQHRLRHEYHPVGEIGARQIADALHGRARALRTRLRQPGKNVPSGLLSSGVYLSLIAR